MKWSPWQDTAKSKHGIAQKTPCECGTLHDSKKEKMRCSQLSLLERAGEITHLVRQPFYPFVINGTPVKMSNGHTAGVTLDFSYQTISEVVAEDVKPKSKKADSRDWPLRKAIFKHLYPLVSLREIR